MIGALFALRFHISLRAIGLIMAFGSGVLISAVAFDLVEEAAPWAESWATASPGCARYARRRRRWIPRATIAVASPIVTPISEPTTTSPG